MTGVPDQTLRSWLKQDGIPRRPRTSRGWTRIPHAEVELIVKLYERGMTQREIGELVGKHQTAVGRTLRLAGVSRPKSEQCKLGHKTRRKQLATT